MTEALNPAQRAAILDEGHALLIVAGPGTGKTLTLVRKIAHLLDSAVDPAHLTAITFTIKAAEEMRKRLKKLCGDRTLPFIGTFHALGLRLLRQHGSVLGLPRDVKVFGEEERARVLAQAAESAELGFGKKELAEALQLISLCKNQRIGPRCLEMPAQWSRALFLRLFEGYEAGLERHGALDFDDLVKRAAELLELAPKSRRAIQENHRYLFVDEYQDINEAQYRFLLLLAGARAKICAIGDPDQAIYAFRGSDPRHFPRFREDFPGGNTVYLERNYRSSQTVIQVASALIGNNRERLHMELVAESGPGPPVTLFQAADPWKEAAFITREIETLIGGTDRLYIDRSRSTAIYDDSDGYHFADFAVLYRTKAQGRIIESAFRKCGLPFQTVAGTPWYRREEIRVPLAYLHLLLAPDPIHLAEILNKPPRGLAAEAVRLVGGLPAWKTERFWQSLMESDSLEELPPAQRHSLLSLAAELRDLAHEVSALTAGEGLQLVLDRLGLLELYRDGSARGEKRYQNLLQLAATTAPFDSTPGLAGLEQFLNYYQLLGEYESYDGKRSVVTLMTLHASKGLEFPVVFIAGLEEGLLPYARKGQASRTEEERRLFYVGLTRAKYKLYLTRATQRDKGKNRRAPSPFLAELPDHLLDRRQSKSKKRKNMGGDAQLSLF